MCQRAAEDSKFRPFCSARCQQQDLVNWLDGAYRLEPLPLEGARPNSPEDDEES